jgi:hypothetical protein
MWVPGEDARSLTLFNRAAGEKWWIIGLCGLEVDLEYELRRLLQNYSVTGSSEMFQSLPSKIEMWSVFIGV